MKLTAKRFRVKNYRNIDDSGWIPLERVTAFVGRNEAGKTTLLKALHKFHPAIEEPYNAQREFPRDRFTAEYKNGTDWPVCLVEFELSKSFQETLETNLGSNCIPKSATFTRYYDGHCDIVYDIEITDDSVASTELTVAFDQFAKGARRIKAPDNEQKESTQDLRATLLKWVDEKKSQAASLQYLRTSEGVELIEKILQEADTHSQPLSANLIEELLDTAKSILTRAKSVPLRQQIDEELEAALPVFIYFENYGILDSKVYLPRFLEDLKVTPNDPRVRTINAMFKYVQLEASEIANLGREKAQAATTAGQHVTTEAIQSDQGEKELRSIKLNAASIDISKKFSNWFGQRRHKIRYQADGNYFRIWVSDNCRSDVDIELESRSKGFQWFFSFYLVFLVESDEGHKDAMLLLDEPGLHLHPTAQQELLTFFDKLAVNNPLAYTTHSPFLIDGKHIHCVRPVTEDESGHSRINVGTWPKDRETIFPLQAAAGYAMVRGLFQHRKNVLVEGMSDYLYLHALNIYCRALGRTALPDDIYITPCGGTKHVGHIASLFLGQKVRPVVLLDGDDAGRARQDALMKELYNGHEKAVLMLSDVLQYEKCETEDIIGEEVLFPTAKAVLGNKLQINSDDRKKGGLVDQIKSAATRCGIDLVDGWKPEVARRLVVAWSEAKPEDIPIDVIERAEALFKEINKRFTALHGTKRSRK